MHPEAAVPSNLSWPGSDVGLMSQHHKKLLGGGAGWGLDWQPQEKKKDSQKAGWCMIKRYLEGSCVQSAHRPAARKNFGEKAARSDLEYRQRSA